jgi:hypothetical protein
MNDWLRNVHDTIRTRDHLIIYDHDRQTIDEVRVYFDVVVGTWSTLEGSVRFHAFRQARQPRNKFAFFKSLSTSPHN